MVGMLTAGSRMGEYPVPAPALPHQRWKIDAGVSSLTFFPLWKPPQAWGGAEGPCGPGCLWVFSGGGGRIGGWHFCTASCEMSRGKEVPLHRPFLGPGLRSCCAGRRGQETSIEPSSVLPRGGGDSLLSSLSQSCPDPRAHPCAEW